jgi:hypothetical protein
MPNGKFHPQMNADERRFAISEYLRASAASADKKCRQYSVEIMALADLALCIGVLVLIVLAFSFCAEGR